MRMTLRTSMPTTPASCGFSLTARIERPIAVRVSSRCTATTSTAATAERQQLVGRRPDAAAERHRDLQRLGEIGGLRGEDEFEQAAQRQRRAETRHDHDDDGAALRAQPAEQQRIDQQRQAAVQRDGDKRRDRQRPAEGERPDRRQQAAESAPSAPAIAKREIGAPGDELAMREIGEAQDRIGQRHADRAEPDHRAGDQAVHERLRVHGARLRLCRAPR